MVKRTLLFTSPVYLKIKRKQLLIEYAGGKKKYADVVDLGLVVLEHPQITITHGVLNALLENNCALVTCNYKHMPAGLMLPLAANTLQSERYQNQINATVPLKKQLWQQTVQAKIRNQASVLALYGFTIDNMLAWAKSVRSGDSENREATAAVYYWSELFKAVDNFTREREGVSPNNFLNYGYAILRAVVARALVGAGLIVTLGIHHDNRYNAYCLADDIMEPYRPYVDMLVYEILEEYGENEDIPMDIKAKLLKIPVLDTIIRERRRPLMNAVEETTASLVQCFAGETRKLSYPEIPCSV